MRCRQRFDLPVAGVCLILLALYALGTRPAEASVYTVVSIADAGPGTLRQAILDANGHAGADEIRFALGLVKTIQPQSPLPVVAGPTDVNGASQPGWTGRPLIEISGAGAGSATGLHIAAAGSIVRGLVVNRFSGDGIVIDAGSVTVEGCWIGTDFNGTQARANGGDGIRVASDAGAARIGGTTVAQRNVVSGNAGHGIAVQNGSFSKVLGNFVGTTADGTAALGNGGAGVFVASPGNRIGDPTSGTGNVISGNREGIEVEADASVVVANRIGLNAAGTAAIGNSGSGIRVYGPANSIGLPGQGNVVSGNGSVGVYLDRDAVGTVVRGNRIGTDASGMVAIGNLSSGIRTYADDGTIGGAALGDGNLVSANRDGVEISFPATRVALLGNVIGLDAAGGALLPNGSGVRVFSNANVIGRPGAGNVISGNNSAGIVLSTAQATDNVVQANLIGVAADGVTARQNSTIGIRIADAFDNLVGGTASGEGNIIAYQTLYGIDVFSGDGNTLVGNEIFSNEVWPIATEPDVGPIANDAGDGDLGANRRQNFPELASATAQAGSVTVSGRLRSEPDTDYRIEIFGDSACAPGGFGQARTYLGFVPVKTDATGTATISVSVPVPQGITSVAATATDLLHGDTSKVSPCVATAGPNAGVVEFSEGMYVAREHEIDGVVSVQVVRSGGASGTITVDYATSALSAEPGVDYLPASGTLRFADGEVMKSFDVVVVPDVLPEGYQEVVLLALSNPTGGAAIGYSSTSAIAILDYDPANPSVHVSGATVIEGDDDVARLAFTITADPHMQPLTVGFYTRDGTATASVDYEKTEGQAVFAVGESTRTVLVPILGDVAPEDDEILYLELSPQAAIGIGGHGEGRILDDDTPGAVAPSSTCIGGTVVARPKVVITGLGGAPGQQRLTVSARLLLDGGQPAGTTPLDLASRGVQVRVEDLGDAAHPLLDLTQDGAAIPPGQAGSSACGALDGWVGDPFASAVKYVNRSNAMPAACTAGSAQGLALLRVTDKRTTRGTVNVALRTRIRDLAMPPGPLRLSLVLGADAGASLGGACGTHTFAPGDCTLRDGGAKLVCR